MKKKNRKLISNFDFAKKNPFFDSEKNYLRRKKKLWGVHIFQYENSVSQKNN